MNLDAIKKKLESMQKQPSGGGSNNQNQFFFFKIYIVNF